MISILIPTRNRPARLAVTITSIVATSRGNTETLVYIADDDISYDGFHWPDRIGGHAVRIVRGPRLCFSDLWNALVPSANGDILMLCADDVVFRTDGWDLAVESAFQEFPDRIMLAYADDGGPNGKHFATLPFVSRRWIDVVGYFTPSGFTADYSDTWPNDVADMIGRKRYVDVLIEHCHHVWGKAEMDQTYRENMERWRRDRPDQQYERRLPERKRDAEKLRAAMK